MRKLTAALTALSSAVLVAAGCGGDGQQAASAATELVPAGAVVYGEATLRPEGDQKEAVDALLAKFPGGDRALAELREQIEKSLRESDAGLSYGEDVEPWLGDEAAFYVASFGSTGEPDEWAVLVKSEDDEQAQDALERTADGEVSRRTHNGVEYMVDAEGAGVVHDGFAVVGSERAIKKVIDTSEGGDSLAEDDPYGDAVDDAAEDRLGLVYMNSRALAQSMSESGMPFPRAFGRLLEDPVVVTVSAQDDGVTVEGSIPEGLGQFSFLGQGSDLIEDLPADSWLAMAQPEFRRLLDLYVETIGGAIGGRDVIEQQLRAGTGLDLERDVLSWMGDFAVFARGSTLEELNGALIVETTDEAASGRLLAALERLARAEGSADVGPLSAPGGGDGFTVRAGGVPQPIHLFQRDGRVVVAYGDAAAADAIGPGERLGDSSEFGAARDSLGDYRLSAYLRFGPVWDLVDATGAAADEDWQKAKPYLEPLSALVAGTSGDGEDMRSALKIVVK